MSASEPTRAADPPRAQAQVEVIYDRGLHARPSTVIAQHAQRYGCDVALVLASVPHETSTPVGTRANAKNVMEVMFLAVPCGARLDIEASGADAQAAVDDLSALFGDSFGL